MLKSTENETKEILKKIKYYVGANSRPRIIVRSIFNSKSEKIGERYQLPTVAGDSYDLFKDSTPNHSIKDVQKIFKENFQFLSGDIIKATSGYKTVLDYDNVYIGEPVENFVETYNKVDLCARYYRSYVYFLPQLNGNLAALNRLLLLIKLCYSITKNESIVFTDGKDFKVYFKDFEHLIIFLGYYLNDLGCKSVCPKLRIGDKFSDGSVSINLPSNDFCHELLATLGYRSSYMPRTVADVNGKFCGNITSKNNVVCTLNLEDYFILSFPLSN